MATNRTPSHLSEGSQTWMRGLRDARDFTATEWRLLTLAAEAYDRAQTARRTLQREGLTLTAPILSKKGDPIGERITAHPAVGIHRDAAALFSKLTNQLGIDARAIGAADVPDAGEARPPSVLDQLTARREAKAAG